MLEAPSEPLRSAVAQEIRKFAPEQPEIILFRPDSKIYSRT